MIAVCPRCRARLDTSSRCSSCRQSYPTLASIRVLLPDPDSHLARWRQQLGFILAQASETIVSLATQMSEADLGSATRTRIQSLARAIAEQADDIAVVLGPVLGGHLPPAEGVGLPRGAADYISYLFRDWAWSDSQADGDAGESESENARSLAAVRGVSDARPLGRVLVLGAGACRLAYDLHLHGGATATAVVDVDPYLLVMAEAVIRGGTVALTETSVNAPEVDPVSRRWTLTSPSGPLGPEAFQFFLADGTLPPFADESFDTIVTPWFIDQVPTDLSALLRRLHALLAPGGRWLNHGPLIYRPDALPITRWYARQEIFDLAATVGFRMGAWQSASQPSLVSPLTGRGLIENVLTFEATRA